MIDVTLRDLETTKQGVGEKFSKYMTRWKTKASRMVNRTIKRDQINIIIKNLVPAYNSRLLSLCISLFGELCDYAINNVHWEKVRISLQPKKNMEKEQPPLKHPIP